MDGPKPKGLSMRNRKPAVLPEPKPSFLLSAEVRSLLRCSKRTLIRYYKGYERSDGTHVRPVLTSVRRGGAVLFPKSVVDSFITNRTVVAA
jgi:hypothetical protein